jgi:hypothetical protein
MVQNIEHNLSTYRSILRHELGPVERKSSYREGVDIFVARLKFKVTLRG